MQTDHGTSIESSLVTIHAGRRVIVGDLAVPLHAAGVVVFAHGRDSTRSNPRNRVVASALGEAGFATLRCDLLDSDDVIGDLASPRIKLEVALLANRLIGVLEWVSTADRVAGLPIGVFATNAGAAAALTAATHVDLAAIVTRGGRIDLAPLALPFVHSPTLVIVGGIDRTVVERDRRAVKNLGGPALLHVIPDASPTAEDIGAIPSVIDATTRWFRSYLPIAD